MTDSAGNTPSIDPAFNYSLVGSIQFAFQKLMQSINGMLPAQIISYDRVTNRAQVQILITILTTNGSQVPRPTVASVPVLILGAGMYSVSFPINQGDLGWILANDRDMSLFLQSYEQSPPNTDRVKQFSDGLFIPDAMKSYNITDSNTDFMIIQKNDGSVSISIGKGSTGADEIDIVADRINIALNDASTGLVTIDGNLIVSGTITAQTITPTGAPIIPFPPIYPP